MIRSRIALCSVEGTKGLLSVILNSNLTRKVERPWERVVLEVLSVAVDKSSLSLVEERGKDSSGGTLMVEKTGRARDSSDREIYLASCFGTIVKLYRNV